MIQVVVLVRGFTGVRRGGVGAVEFDQADGVVCRGRSEERRVGKECLE